MAFFGGENGWRGKRLGRAVFYLRLNNYEGVHG
jgi:hypothetical protein